MRIRYKSSIFIFLILIGMTFVFAEEQKAQAAANLTQEADQQVNDFSLSGYGDRGKKTWDLAGKSADIFNDVVKLKTVEGNLYGKDEDIKLTADRGDFNKSDGKVHLEQNVVITTSAGTKLNTESLDWDRKAQRVSTLDKVNIARDNVLVVALGAQGEPDLKKIAFEKDVKLDINPTEEDLKKENGLKEKITITCDGPLNIDYEKSVATFLNNVQVERQDSTIYSDKMEVYFISSKEKKEKKDKEPGFMGSSIDKIVARGNVRVVRGENTSYSQEAIYTAKDKKLTLTGRPKLVIYSTESLSNASTGN